MRRSSIVAGLVALALVGTLAGAVPPAARHAGALPAAPIWPTPQQRSDPYRGFTMGREVGLVRAPDTDLAAVEVVETALRRAGVRRIRADDDEPGTEVTVWVTGGRARRGRRR